jgi:hypothetical protein
MWQVTVSVEYNGIVLFDPCVVREELGSVRKGTNLFKRFTTTDEGDRVLARGLFVPVLAIDDAGYEAHLRLANEPSRVRDEHVLHTNDTFALRVAGSLAIADLESLMWWRGGDVNNQIEFPAGKYGVSVRGFSSPDLSTAGYEFIFSRVRRLPKVTASTGARMRVLRLDEPRPAR